MLSDRSREQDPVARQEVLGPEARPRVAHTEACGADVHPVRVTALDDLRVACDDRDTSDRSSCCDRIHLCAQLVRAEALLEHEREGQRERSRAGDREIVHGPVHRELADRAPGKRRGRTT